MNGLPQDDLQLVVDATACLWDEMRGGQMFIAGGTGFFGCWLLESFCAANRELRLNAKATLLTRDPERFARKAPHLASNPAVTLLQGDVRTFRFPEGEFSHVVHAAADSCAVPPPRDSEMFDTIATGTRQVLRFASSCRAKKLLLLSSGAVYGPQPAELQQIDEKYVGAASSTGFNAGYRAGKQAAEALCRDYARNVLECKIARCFAFVGPHLPLDAHFAIGNFIGDALAQRPIRVKGDDTPVRSYLYMSDATIWLWNLLFRAPSLRPYNVGSEEALTIGELARLVAEVIAPELEVEMSTTLNTDRAAAPSRYVPSTKAAREELGLRETIGLREAIRRTAAWHRCSAP